MLQVAQHCYSIKSDILHFNTELSRKTANALGIPLNMHVLMRMVMENNKYCHFNCKSQILLIMLVICFRL